MATQSMARIERGAVQEIVPAVLVLDGRNVPLSERFHPSFVATLLPCPAGVETGWLYDGDSFNPPQPLPEPVPIVSRRQFFQQASIVGDITEEEAVAAVATGAIPATMQAFIDAMPEGDRFGARMAIAGATEFDPAHPLSVGYAMATGRTPEQKDQFFRAAAAL